MRSKGELYFWLLVVVIEPSCQTCHPGNNSRRRDPDLGCKADVVLGLDLERRVRASCAKLQQMSPKAFAFSAGGADALLERVDEAALCAGVEAELQVLMQGQAYQEALQIYQLTEDEKNAERTNQQYPRLVRRTFPRISHGPEFDAIQELSGESGSDIEDENGGEQSRCSTPEQGKIVFNEEDMQTPPGPSTAAPHIAAPSRAAFTAAGVPAITWS